MPHVLLSGFEPFDGADANPSWDAVAALADSWDGPAELSAVRLPVEFARASSYLLQAVKDRSPDIVIATGVAQGRRHVTPERVALNLDDARIPDNAGARPVETPIDPEGPAALWSTLPVSRIVEGLTAATIPARVSLSAGAYVCNHTFFRLQAADAPTVRRSGFIHVPATTEMGLGEDVPTMPLATLIEALRIAVATTLATLEDDQACFSSSVRRPAHPS